MLLTTLTTVLGLAPLLYESSQQAQFLKPTVITLVYGLGFGMVLVLLVVPALLAVQEDIRRARVAVRRALAAPGAGRPVRAGTAAAVALAVVLLAGTVGSVLVSGALPGPFAGLLPARDGQLGLALVLFAAVLAVVLLLTYAVTVLLHRRRRP